MEPRPNRSYSGPAPEAGDPHRRLSRSRVGCVQGVILGHLLMPKVVHPILDDHPRSRGEKCDADRFQPVAHLIPFVHRCH